MNRPLTCSVLLLCAAACGDSRPPTQEEIDSAKGHVSLAVLAAHRARSALELLGILPVYTCGEPRRSFVGRVTEDKRRELTCATLTTEAQGDAADAVRFAFENEGCEVRGHTVRGPALFLYNGGEDRMDVAANLTQLEVDGDPLEAEAGYGSCSDEQRYWADARGSLPRHPERSFHVDASVAKRDGIPLIGSTSLVLDGPAEVTGADGTDRITLTALHYEVGEYFPKEGSLLVETASGRRIKATFRPALWKLGTVEVEIDDRDPTTIPIVR